jgi:hypothetical protein
MSKQAIIVLGMHRSGTSLLSGLINLLGIDVASNMMTPKSDNPLGFFEPQTLVNLNNKFLGLLGYDWQTPLPIEINWFLDPLRKQDIREASDFLNQEFSESQLFTFKDPRLCRLLPIWQRALQENNIGVKYLVIFRNPLAVCSSLSVRNGLEYDHSILLWYLYNTDIIRFIKQQQLAFCVSYENLLSQPLLVSEKIINFIGLKDVKFDEKSIYSSVKSSLNHFPEINYQSIIEDKKIPRLVKNFYWDLLNIENKKVSENYLVSSSLSSYIAINQNIEQIYKYPLSLYSLSLSTRKLSTKSAKSIKPRNLIIHYHLFKNAGSSVDVILKQNFGNRWIKFEGDGKKITSEELEKFILERPEIQAISSHTANLPLPVIEGVNIFPIIFLRNPLDRIRSIYDFEKRQTEVTDGSVMAKKSTLAEYIEWRLNRLGDLAIQNFQTLRFAMGYFNLNNPLVLSNLEKAKFVASSLPFVGIVENFDESIQLLVNKLEELEIKIEVPEKVHANKSAVSDNIENRLEELKNMIGEELFARITEENEDDIKLLKSVTITNL